MIRRATLEDVPVIAAIHVRTWQHAYAGIVPAEYLDGLSVQARTEIWRHRICERSCVILVALEDKEIVGFASGGVSRDGDAKDEAEIYAIYIAPEYWERGIGRTLLREMEDVVMPYAGIALWVMRQNERAIRFYRARGYEFDGQEKIVQLGGSNLTEVRFRKKPNQSSEPTSPSVTERAAARSAPAGDVAHL